MIEYFAYDEFGYHCLGEVVCDTNRKIFVILN